MSTKTIAINPDFFSLSSSKKKKKKQRTPKMKPLSNLLKPNLKRELINKIKNHKKQHDKIEHIQHMNSKIEDVDNKDDLQKSIEYLNIISKKRINDRKKKKEKRRHKKTMKNNESNDPPYGILKNGKKPTYSQYKKTLKKNDNKNSFTTNFFSNVEQGRENDKNDVKPMLNATFSPIEIHNDSFEERQNKLKDLKYEFKVDNNKIKKKRKIRTIKRKIKLGKVNGKIGVLIKNNKARKTIKKEITNLKKKSINNVKKYLRKHNLIRIGSPAPDNLLKEIYQESYLSGDIYNKNCDILIHNFIENDK